MVRSQDENTSQVLNGVKPGVKIAKVIKLTPPGISRETIQDRIICTRPMRDGKFNISHEFKNGKDQFNCYGHGGSGWTTLFGSVSKILGFFKRTDISQDVPIKVIGMGCMGLTVAIELKKLGYQVSISAKNLCGISSWRAAGYFALVSLQTSKEEQEELNKIGMDTFRTYQQIEKGQHPYIAKEAVRFMPVYCSADTESGVEDLEARGEIPAKEYVTLEFENGARHENFVKYMTYFMNTTNLMEQLTQEVKKLNIPIIEETIVSLDSIKESVIFNCAGLGARELNQDDKMIPVTGHLQTFNSNAGQGHMEYMIYTKVKQEGRDEYIYLFPKNAVVNTTHPKGVPCTGVFGGSFIKHVDKLLPEEQKALHEREFKKMQERVSQFFFGRPFKS